jgi:hypothetical protein
VSPVSFGFDFGSVMEEFFDYANAVRVSQKKIQKKSRKSRKKQKKRILQPEND